MKVLYGDLSTLDLLDLEIHKYKKNNNKELNLHLPDIRNNCSNPHFPF